MRERLLEVSVAAARGLRAGSLGASADLAWSVEGLLLAGEERAVRDGLDGLLARQRPDGGFPRRLRARWAWTERLGPAAPDAEALVVWAACRYALRRDALAWAGLVLPRLERARARWAELEPAALAFPEALAHWKARSSLAELYAALGRRSAAAETAAEAGTLRRRIERAFWDPGGYYRERAGAPAVSRTGSLAACAWGFADAEQAARILRTLDRTAPRRLPLPEAALKLRLLAALDRRHLLGEAVEDAARGLDGADPRGCAMLLEALSPLVAATPVPEAA